MKRKRYEIKATVYDKRGRKIAVGYNSYTRTHSLMKYFAKKAGESEHKICLHSELAALLKAKDRKVDTIVVERYDAEGNPAMAKPCLACQEAIRAFGAREVKFTDNGFWGSYKVE